MWLLLSQQSRAMPCISGHHETVQRSASVARATGATCPLSDEAAAAASAHELYILPAPVCSVCMSLMICSVAWWYSLERSALLSLSLSSAS